MMKEYILKNIKFHYEDGEMYGLKVFFEFKNGGSLYFDLDTFYTCNPTSIPNLKLEAVDYKEIHTNDIRINEVKEDEGQAYFLRFSNGDIFHIYQKIESLEYWEQDFELLNKEVDTERYLEVEEHMNEDFVKDSVFEKLIF